MTAFDHTKLLTSDNKGTTKTAFYLPHVCEQTKRGLFRQGTLYSRETAVIHHQVCWEPRILKALLAFTDMSGSGSICFRVCLVCYY